MILQIKWPHARHRFRRESIFFTTNFVAGDIGRNTRQNHTLPPCDAVCQFTLDDRKVSPIFSAKKVISVALKVCFRTLHEITAEAIIIIVAFASLSPWQQ